MYSSCALRGLYSSWRQGREAQRAIKNRGTRRTPTSRARRKRPVPTIKSLAIIRTRRASSSRPYLVRGCSSPPSSRLRLSPSPSRAPEHLHDADDVFRIIGAEEADSYPVEEIYDRWADQFERHKSGDSSRFNRASRLRKTAERGLSRAGFHGDTELRNYVNGRNTDCLGAISLSEFRSHDLLLLNGCVCARFS